MAEQSALTLFVKASTINASDLGADVFAQRFMMMLVLKDVSVTISLVDTIKSRTMKKLPALQFTNVDLIDDQGEIEKWINRINVGHHPLECENKSVNDMVYKGCGSRVYHKFCQLVKNADPNVDERLKESLTEELRALNKELNSLLNPESKEEKEEEKKEEKKKRFLGGENMSIPDCILLPKLLHIKVVAKAFKDFEIPNGEDFTSIHEYMDAANGKGCEEHDINVEAFTRTSPSEEVIVDAWARSMKVPNPFQHKKKKTPSTST